jgi:hypothetical protein
MWLDQQVSLFNTHHSQVGTTTTLRDILFTAFAVPHDGRNDLDTIIDLRGLDPNDGDYDIKKRKLKSTTQGYTPAATMATRGLSEDEKRAGMKIEDKVITRTGIVPIDFDDLEQFDISEVKRAIGALPFVGYCGLSVSGRGLFALVLTAEPERQREYAEHLFDVFTHYGIPPDTSKGRNVNDLRYVSYDSNPVINDNPEPLRIKRFKPKPAPQPQRQQKVYQSDEMKKAKAVNNAVSNISGAQVGQRFEIVRHWSYALGGFGDAGLLEVVKDAIRANPAFTGQEPKYLKHADEGFEAGSKRLFA